MQVLERAAMSRKYVVPGSAEQRALGACVFARGKGAVALERCARGLEPAEHGL
mgnify:CR=1 FL=1